MSDELTDAQQAVADCAQYHLAADECPRGQVFLCVALARENDLLREAVAALRAYVATIPTAYKVTVEDYRKRAAAYDLRFTLFADERDKKHAAALARIADALEVLEGPCVAASGT